jgi:tRNA 2-selenouridine synthase
LGALWPHCNQSPVLALAVIGENKGMTDSFKPTTKTAAVIAVAQALEKLTGYGDIIDVRSPSEYALDHLPGAINLPVLTDEQRHQVGLIHKTQDAFAGSRLGAPMVASNIAQHLQTVLADKPRLWRPLIYCWRGGQRSQSMATVLAKVGWKVELLEGGYRAFRRYVCDYFAAPAWPLNFVVLAGRTGTAKSLVLTHLAKCGQQVLDLEGLANHKGSVLGLVPGQRQPSQKQFESLLWQAVRGFHANRPVFVEAESKKVGTLHIPDNLMAQIRQSPAITIEASLDWRARYLLGDYHYFTTDASALFSQLDCLAGLHSHSTINSWKALACSQRWHDFVQALLNQHYDPAYDRAIGKNYTRSAGLAPIELTNAVPALACEQAASQILAQLR